MIVVKLMRIHMRYSQHSDQYTASQKKLDRYD